MDITQIKETALYIQDLDRTQSFYDERLGFEVISRVEGRHIFFRTGSSVLLCFIAEATKKDESLPPHFGEGNMHIAFEVAKEKYRQVKEDIRSEGIEIEYEQKWTEDIESFYFRDPDRHLLEIVPEGMWE